MTWKDGRQVESKRLLGGFSKVLGRIVKETVALLVGIQVRLCSYSALREKQFRKSARVRLQRSREFSKSVKIKSDQNRHKLMNCVTLELEFLHQVASNILENNIR